MSDGPHISRSEPGKRISIVLAVAVHIALAVFLIYGVRWQTKARDVVEVDLVPAPPSQAAAEPAPPPPPEPKVEPKPEPKIEPKPEPKPVPPPPKPDIAIKEKPKPKEEPKARLPSFLNALNDEFKQLTNRKTAEQAAHDKAAQEATQAAAARGKAVAAYVDRIRGKIRGNIVLPPELPGNPVAVFDVVQLPSGEVISARLAKPSGFPAYDAAVERAILKSSPLPKPDSPADFSRTLNLTFCPQETGCK